MLLFSLPVHEKPQVVVNQIDNFRKYNPGCEIILHISMGMPEGDFKELSNWSNEIDFVHINPLRLRTGWADGTLFKAHMENLRRALFLEIPFSHVCFHASNDLFVKTGLESWIQGFEAGFDPINKGKNNPVYQQIAHFKKDWGSRKLARKHGLKEVLGSQIEGTFYSRELVRNMVLRVGTGKMGELGNFFSLGYDCVGSLRWWVFRWAEVFLRRLNFSVQLTPFCKEEVYFTTLVADLIQDQPTRKMGYCFMNWHTQLNVTEEEVHWVRENDVESLHRSKNLYVPEDSKSDIAYFAVKRVDRDLENPLRKYIDRLEVI